MKVNEYIEQIKGSFTTFDAYLTFEYGFSVVVDAKADGSYDKLVEGFLDKIEKSTFSNVSAEPSNLEESKEAGKVILDFEKEYQKDKEEISGASDEEKRKAFLKDKIDELKSYLSLNGEEVDFEIKDYGDIIKKMDEIKKNKKTLEEREEKLFEEWKQLESNLEKIEGKSEEELMEVYTDERAEFLNKYLEANSLIVGENISDEELVGHLEDATKWYKSEENAEEIGFGQAREDREHVDAEWISSLEGSWKSWCEEKSYIYERNEEDKKVDGFICRYYKNEEAKNSNTYGAEVHYKDENSLRVKTKDGSPADYEVWQNIVKIAKTNGQTVNFSKVRKEENKAKLFLACTVLGVEASNVDASSLDFSKSFAELSPEEKLIAKEKLGLNDDGKTEAQVAAEQQAQSEPVQPEPTQEEGQPQPEPVQPEPTQEEGQPQSEPVQPEPVQPEPTQEEGQPQSEPVQPEPTQEEGQPQSEPVQPEPTQEEGQPQSEPVQPEPTQEEGQPQPEPVQPEPTQEEVQPQPEPVQPEPTQEEVQLQPSGEKEYSVEELMIADLYRNKTKTTVSVENAIAIVCRDGDVHNINNRYTGKDVPIDQGGYVIKEGFKKIQKRMEAVKHVLEAKGGSKMTFEEYVNIADKSDKLRADKENADQPQQPTKVPNRLGGRD